MIRLKMDGDRMVYQLGGSVPVPRLTWREKARILKELWLDPVEIRFDRDSLSLLIARIAYLFDKLFPNGEERCRRGESVPYARIVPSLFGGIFDIELYGGGHVSLYALQNGLERLRELNNAAIGLIRVIAWSRRIIRHQRKTWKQRVMSWVYLWATRHYAFAEKLFDMGFIVCCGDNLWVLAHFLLQSYPRVGVMFAGYASNRYQDNLDRFLEEYGLKDRVVRDRHCKPLIVINPPSRYQPGEGEYVTWFG